MNKMRHTFIAITAALTISLPGAASAAQFQKAEMAGYLLVSSDKVPDAYNAGFSLYAAAWPLLQQYPGHRFQTGLFGTWMHAQYEGKPPAHLYSDIEGGLGWWRDTRFPTETPKFIMGGVAVNFQEIANGPAHGWGTWDKPRGLYGVAQLSPWLLFPIDGLNVKQGTCGDLFGCPMSCRFTGTTAVRASKRSGKSVSNTNARSSAPNGCGGRAATRSRRCCRCFASAGLAAGIGDWSRVALRRIIRGARRKTRPSQRSGSTTFSTATVVPTTLRNMKPSARSQPLRHHHELSSTAAPYRPAVGAAGRAARRRLTVPALSQNPHQHRRFPGCAIKPPSSRNLGRPTCLRRSPQPPLANASFLHAEVTSTDSLKEHSSEVACRPRFPNSC